MKKLLSLHIENLLADVTGSIISCHYHKNRKQGKNKQNNNRMAKVTINSYDEFAEYLGKEIGTTDWFQIDQDRINLFADATPTTSGFMSTWSAQRQKALSSQP